MHNASEATSGFGSLFMTALLTAVFAGGCGDGPICPSEMVVVIQAPAANASVAVSDDMNASAAGIQVDVSARSNLKDASFTLTVTDAAGAVAEYNAESDGEGDVTFAGITLPAGAVTLLVAGESETCGSGSDETEVTVITDAFCDLTIDQGPIEEDYFAPIPVLNSTNDADSDLPNFQATFTVEAAAGFTVEAFVLDVESGSEASLGTMTADDSGSVSFEATLAQGKQTVRATCTEGSTSAASATSTVHVDTVVPTCTLDAPVSGVTVTPDDDEQDPIDDGIQMTWAATIDDAGEGDVEGEESSFFRDAQEFAGTTVDSSLSVTTASFAEYTAPGTFATRFVTQDHAGNPCEDGFDVSVIMEGCTIAIDEPGGTVTADSNGDDGDGLQSDFIVDVGVDCAGQDVFVDCGLGETSATVAADGRTTIPDVTLSASAVSQGQETCTARVVNSDGFQTSDSSPVSWDTQAPPVTLSFVDPVGLGCGQSMVLDVANDVDGDLGNGLQIDVAALAPFADTREARVTNDACTAGCTYAEAGNMIRVTLEPGDNDIRAVARDSVGNEATTGSCVVAVADIAVAFDAPVSSGELSSGDGTVNGDGDLEITVCGTVSDDMTTVNVTVDGAGTNPATVAAGAWCTDAPVVLSQGNHALVATADSTVDSSTGSATQFVSVDVEAPDSPLNFQASSSDRKSLDASWDASAGAVSYEFRYSTEPFGDFDSEGTGISQPGTSVALDPFYGGMYYVGVVAIDSFGNRSAPTTLGPVAVTFDMTGEITSPAAADDPGGVAPADTDGEFGYRVVHGNFNNDDYDDIAISAYAADLDYGAGIQDWSGAVYIYFGSMTGIPASPDVTLRGTPGAFSAFGLSMARIDWGGTGDALAVGAPGDAGGEGVVYVYYGDTIASDADGVIDVGDADLSITPNGAANWFSGGQVGWSLAAGQIDGGGSEDLIIGTVGVNSFEGGVAIVYGGTPTASTILLSDTDDSGMAGLVGHYFAAPAGGPSPDPDVFGGVFLGDQLDYLGDTDADGLGDVGVAYREGAVDGDTLDVVILRGRSSIPSSGMEEISLAAGDLVVRSPNPLSDGSWRAFGERMASISDQNGDGARDIVITAYGELLGQVWIVSGAETGTLVLGETTGFLARIGAVNSTVPNFGGAVANNALSSFPDVNSDGVEDLAIVGGRSGVGDGVRLFVWYGENIPSGGGVATSASADYIVEAPAAFRNARQDVAWLSSTSLAWAGDVNNDGLEDLCWADYRREEAGDAFEVLWDDQN